MIYAQTLISAVLLSFSLGVCASGQQQTIALATGNDYAPFADQHLPNGGMVTELVSVVFYRLGYVPEVQFVPWKRGYLMAATHEVVGTFPYVKDTLRSQDFLFSDSLITLTERFFVRIDQHIQYEDASSLVDKVVCRPIGYTLETIQDYLPAEDSLVWRPSSLSKCFELLAFGRVDLVPINQHVGWATIENNSLIPKNYETLPVDLSINTSHFIMAKDYPQADELMAAFNRELAEMREEGVVDLIYKKHLSGWSSR